MNSGKMIRRGMKRGQTMVEYVIVTVLLLAVVAAMAHLVTAVRNGTIRTETLVSSDYP